MKITKFEHSCLLIENGDRALAIDPGEFSKSFKASPEIDALVITHEHPDHYNPEKVAEIIAQNPNVVIFTTHKVEQEIREKFDLSDQQIIVVENGQKSQIGTFDLEFFGRDHAEIVDGVVPCDNFGIVVNNLLAYAGDSFVAPPIRPQVLAVPASAPWLKIYESMQFIAKTKPTQVFPTHNALLSPIGEGISCNWLRKSCEENGVEFIDLQPGDAIEV